MQVTGENRRRGKGGWLQTAAAVLLAAGVLLSVSGGCGRREQTASVEKEGFVEEPSAPAKETYDQSRSPSRSMEAEAAEDALSGGEPSREPEGAPGVETGVDPGEAGRMRVYQGYCRILVGSAEEPREQLFALAGEWGGYVESVAGDTVVIRVPAARFQETFDLVLALGEVLDSSVETFDVTEQFTDLEARLDIARRTRERLYALLERTRDVEERLKILREIRRLTEQIERISRRLEMLEDQVAFSRITVELVPRLGARDELRRQIPFRWIADLDPLYASLPRVKGRVVLEPGPDFAVFDKERSYRAESADGVRVRVGSTENEPRGDGYFWQQALSFHLGPAYRNAQPVQAGQVQG
ncbi:MAG: DUF4349 domain-containing protein, partial [Spirochaetota bacterium]